MEKCRSYIPETTYLRLTSCPSGIILSPWRLLMEMENISRFHFVYPLSCRLSSISGDHSTSSPRREQCQLGDEGNLGVPSQQWPCSKAPEGKLRVQDHPYAQPRWCHQWQVCHLSGPMDPLLRMCHCSKNPLPSHQRGVSVGALILYRDLPWAPIWNN